MKRSELYDLVWSEPVDRLAKSMGISGVALAKRCRRLDIPLPPRGYWAKLQAGKKSPKAPLPRKEYDPLIEIHIVDLAEKEAARDKKLAEDAETAKRMSELNVQPVQIADALRRPHPLIKATAIYCARLPKLIAKYQRRSPYAAYDSDIERPPYEDHGRYQFNVSDGLCLTVSADAMNWVLRFHDAVFKALVRSGAVLQRVERTDRKPTHIACNLNGEHLSLNFREGYRRIAVDPKELAKARREKRWFHDWRYEPSRKFTLSVAGTEFGLSKEWSGSTERMESLLTEIVTTCLDFLHRQPEIRKARLIEEERRREEAQQQEKRRRIAAARREQLNKAMEAADAYDRLQSLIRFLDVVEKEIPRYREPYGERAEVWLKVVREEIEQHNPYLEIIGECLSASGWRTWPPEWWPNEPTTPDS